MTVFDDCGMEKDIERLTAVYAAYDMGGIAPYMRKIFFPNLASALVKYKKQAGSVSNGVPAKGTAGMGPPGQ